MSNADIGFWTWARRDPARIALVTPEAARVTFGELADESNRVANGLHAMGLRRGDSLAVITPNVAEFYEIFLGAVQIGLYLTPINSYLAAPEIAYVLGDCEAKAFFIHAQNAEAAGRAIAEIGYPLSRCIGLAGAAGFAAYADFKAAQSADPPHPRSAGMPMVYTSGTTGFPKGVRRGLPDASPEDPAVNNVNTALGNGWASGDAVYLLNGPLHHSAPIAFSVPALHLGHTVVMTEKWDAEQVLRLIHEHRVTNSQMVPIHFNRLLKLPQEVRAKYDVSSVRSLVHSAAPCPVPVKQAMIDWFGPVLFEMYGGTEGAGAVVTSEEWLRKPGTVGHPPPGVDLKILDDEGADLPTGEVGTVYIRPAGDMPEYFKAPDKTLSARRGDYFTLGDMGYLDADGYLFLVDRKADMVVSGGVNIYPAEIEAALLQHPAVQDVAVFGIPNEEWGEELKAVVQLAPAAASGGDLTSDIRDFCAARLARFKIPRSFDFVAELPRAPNGKLYKRQLRDPYWSGRDRSI